MRRRRLLGAIGAVISLGFLERRLARAAIGDGPDTTTVRCATHVAAPRERVWAELADLEGQTRWMHDARTIRILTPGPVGVGTRAEADVRILGLGVLDPVVVTAWEPPARFAIAHAGRFAGRGEIRLADGPQSGTTELTWEETLRAPILPHVAGLMLQPVLRHVFQADLERLRALAEAN